TLAKELPNDSIRFSSKVVSIEQHDPYNKLLRLADGSAIKTKVLIGCDGVNSAVGRWLGLKKPYICHKRLLDFKQSHGLDPKFIQFMGDGVRYGFVPIDDTSLYWFFITFTSSGCSERTSRKPVEVEAICTKQPRENYRPSKSNNRENKNRRHNSPIRSRPPWESLWRNVAKGNVCVAGDAFHPMTPDLGQGACSSLEDSVVLARCLGQTLLRTKDTRDGVMENKRAVIGLKEYAKEMRWRVVDLTITGYVMGFIEQSNWMVVKFLRDRVLSTYLNGLLLKKGSFGFGELAKKTL
ncbi:hypothetical protein V2J09_000364, partial [Rumex salicifolius]